LFFFFPVCPSPVFLLSLSCPSCPCPAFLLYLSCPMCPCQAFLLYLSCLMCPYQVFLLYLSCPMCTSQAFLLYLSCPMCPCHVFLLYCLLFPSLLYSYSLVLLNLPSHYVLYIMSHTFIQYVSILVKFHVQTSSSGTNTSSAVRKINRILVEYESKDKTRIATNLVKLR
jgi:hypothetical protein